VDECKPLLYGPVVPDFVEVSHKEALRMAQTQLKFLFVYLHSPSHGDVPAFCRDVLAAPAVTAMLREHFVVWGRGLHLLTSELNLRIFVTHRSR
jgi:hypothetical protein